MADVDVESLAVKTKIREMLNSESGMERVKRIYSLDEYGTFSPELLFIMKGGYTSLVFGGVLGAIGGMKEARDNFLRSNEGTAFESQHLARRKLSDTMAMSGIRAMIKQGLKIGTFTTSYLLLSLTAANYSNKMTIWQHVASGAFLGSVFRIRYGPRGMLAAGFLGGTLGLFAGGTLQISMWLTGTTYQELLYSQHERYAENFMMQRKQNKKNAEENRRRGPDFGNI